jgi:uncharacterized protein YecE (DUF72 family)
MPERAPHLHVGVSGWTRPDWGPLWPEALEERRLALLARTFGCLEVDTTRFATPALRTVQRWVRALARADTTAGSSASPPADAPGDPATHAVGTPRDVRAPPSCRLVLEVPAALLEAEAPTEGECNTFKDALRPLVRAKRLGALLARFDVELLYGPSEVRRLGRIALALEPMPLALEVRHPSWWDPRALDALRGIGWSLAHVDAASDWRRAPARHAPTGPLGLLRLAGRGGHPAEPAAAHLGLGPEASDHRYAPPVVLELARRARAIAREVDECFVIAANVARGQALATAFELRWLCVGEGPLPAWPSVEAAYPDLVALHAAPPRLEPGPI